VKIINLGIVFKTLGISILISGLFMLTAIPFAVVFNENTIIALILSSFISILAGFLLFYFNKKSNVESLGKRDAFCIVTLTWILLGFFGSLPYILSGAIPNITNAYFETISGFTTTGASILTNIESLPKSILFWRSLTQWLGGMGILVLIIAILPVFGFGGIKIFVAEVSSHIVSKIHPKIKNTALRLWFVYLGLTLLFTLLLMLGKMNFYESLCHTFSALSTGGFSPKNTSISNYSSYIQYTICILMLIGGVNFTLIYLAAKGKFKQLFNNEEVKSFIALIIILSLLVSGFLLFNNNYNNFSDAIKHSLFQVVSIITTTGYCTADFVLWPIPVVIIILSLYFVGGMIGSTAGGPKFTRYLVLIKNIRVEIRRIIHPKAVVPLKLNNKIISYDITQNFFIIFIVYIVTFCIGTIAMSFFVSDVKEVISITMTCLNGIGPGFGQFGPMGNYNELHDFAKWILSFLMILGRLEIIPVIILFNISFWKK